MRYTIFLDGKYIFVTPRVLRSLTPGVFKAKGVFETMLALDGVILDADLHLRRLCRGLKVLGVPRPSIDPSLFKKILVQNHLLCARVRIMVWQEGSEAHVMASAQPYKISNKKKYHVCLVKTDRLASARFSDVKSLDYSMFAAAYAYAKTHGYDEALLLNRHDHIVEASRANIFWIKNSILYTPPLTSGCLNGITRRQVIRMVRRLKIPLKEKNLTLEMLNKADAAFLTSSLIGIKPINVALYERIDK
ncbi:MAG: aminotransferase class IV [Candidatus Omnitrophica bacterium]|nr:aminotransferase class IV [Candidatus Omnitrophota bacterium]